MCEMIVLYRMLGGLLPAYWLAALCHEWGHCVCGMMCGARLCVLRVGAFIWTGGHIKPWVQLKRYHTPGQCLLWCENEKALCAAAVGGCLCNFVSGVISFFLLAKLEEKHALRPNGVGGMLLFDFALLSVLMSLINILPLSWGSDGARLIRLTGDVQLRRDMCEDMRNACFLVENGAAEEVI